MGLWEDVEAYSPSGETLPTIDELKQIYPQTDEETLERWLKDKLFLDELVRRRYFIDRFGWSVPLKESMEKIKTFMKFNQENLRPRGGG